MRTQLIATLDSPGLSLVDAGGKGANLNAMRCAGFPVPPGFVVLTAVYRRFVADNALDALIAEQWQRCDPQRPDTFETASQVVRAAFIAGKLAGDLANAIERQYAALGASVPVAVRSSATAEDLPDASFAGQQDTYLNVRGVDNVLAAVQRCWGSLWTARAMAYRLRQEIGPQEVSLAVVVQEMAPARAAGVLFTINPVTGSPAEMMINATWGLGEALVSGHVTPDMILVDKDSATIKRVVLGDKLVMTAAADDGTGDGTVETPVAAEKRTQQAVNTAEIAELVRLGLRLERHFGKPQDVEWAVLDGAKGIDGAEGHIVLLQTRPVTTAIGASQHDGVPQPPGDDVWPPMDLPAQPFDLWTTYDVGERWPEPVTPFSWSTGYAMIQENMDEALAGLKAPYAGKIQWAKRAFGHVYLNEGALTHAYNDGLGMPMGMVAPSMTGVIPVTSENNRYQWSKMLRHAGFFLGSFTQWETNVKRFVADFDKIDVSVDEFMARDLSGPTDQELWQEAESVWLTRAMHYMGAHSNATSLSLTAYNQLEEFTQRAMGDRSLAPKLAGGISGIIAAEIVPSLWSLAREFEQLGLSEAVQRQPAQAALAELRATPAAAPVMAQLDAFLTRHGHRCMSEAEWLHPRWIEAPELVIESVASYLRAGDRFDPTAAVASAEQERIAATAVVEQRVNLLQRAQFRWILSRVHRFMLARDNGQHYLVKLMLPVRHIYATLAARWAARGWIEAADDFFFLVLEEVEAVLGSQAGAQASSPAVFRAQEEQAGLDLRHIAAERRKAYRFWFGQPMPDVLNADGKPVEFAAASEQGADGLVLVGLAASRGQATGTARVVMTPQEAATIRPGEILVTRATDPGWTPVFSVIGAAVIEIGSTLSHAAIVAREYGLPAVVNIPQATQLIRDGQKIRVDGNSGRVTLLE
ncbi:MAG: PEP/pyruvate-binding domain-containing protein [Caldilineaceae bacterium]